MIIIAGRAKQIHAHALLAGPAGFIAIYFLFRTFEQQQAQQDMTQTENVIPIHPRNRMAIIMARGYNQIISLPRNSLSDEVGQKFHPRQRGQVLLDVELLE